MISERLKIYSLNACHSNIIQSTAFAELENSTEEADLIFIQEPWWFNVENARSVALRGWTPIIPSPKCNIDLIPRVHAYARTDSPFNFTQRLDIIEDTDIQIIDITFHSSATHTVQLRFINVYNQTQQGSQEFAIDKLINIHFPDDTPTILLGDWNCKHPDFGVMPEYQPVPNPQAVNFVEWLALNDYTLVNPHNAATRFAAGYGTESALDLTFGSASVLDQQWIEGWRIDRNLNGGSDHYATLFTVGLPGERVLNPSKAKLNWRGASREDFEKRLREMRVETEQEASRIFGPINSLTATHDEIDAAFEWILSQVSLVAAEIVPVRNVSEHSRPWFDLKCKEAIGYWRLLRDLQVARVAGGDDGADLDGEIAHAKAVYVRAWRKKSKDFHDNITKSATPRNVWALNKWPSGVRQYQSPPISRGGNLPPAVNHQDKCEVFRDKLFPMPPILANPVPFDLDPRHDDLPFHPVTRNEVRDSIMTAASFNAPGPSGLCGAAWKWSWNVIGEEIYRAIAMAVAAGYHPKAFHDSLTVILQKPRKPDYSNPKAYRPIQLLEVLGKILERIQARRLGYICLKENLIPPHQLGGVKGRSTDDLAISLVHDIEAARNRGLHSSMLMLDISGFFDNVSHEYLIMRLREMRIPIELVKWVLSFLSERRTTICLDGQRDEMRVIRTGIPQGSCISPILACCLTANLGKAIDDAIDVYIQETTSFERAKAKFNGKKLPADSMALSKATHSPSPLYVDDNAIIIHSTSLEMNVKILAVGRRKAEDLLGEMGMRTEPQKDALQHFTRQQKPSNPSLTVTYSDGSEVTIPAGKYSKYLGITYDRKLLFNEHVRLTTLRASRAIAASGMLGNSTRGLTPLMRRLLYTVAVRPIMTFGSPVWWKGSSAHVTLLGKTQNQALRLITGGFRTSPVVAMEVESSIPPIALHLDYLTEKFAVRLGKLSPNHPVTIRLPDRIRPAEAIQDTLPFIRPHVGPVLSKDKRLHAKRVRDNAEKYRTCTNLWRMADLFTPNSERIDTNAEPPWHRSQYDDDICKRMEIVVPPNTPGVSPKEEWADAHILEVETLSNDPTALLVYTDGSLTIHEGIRYTGWGFAIYLYGKLVRTDKGALGRHAEVYDAEMEALASAADAVTQLLGDPSDDFVEVNSVHFYSDNTGAIQRIFSAKPGKAQQCSTCFRDAVLDILDRDDVITVSIKWAPGHHDIEGNEQADSLAKEGSFSVPDDPNWHSISFTGSLATRHLQKAWTDQWIARERSIRSDFTLADRIPPQLRPTTRLSELSRPIFSRVFQFRHRTRTHRILLRKIRTH